MPPTSIFIYSSIYPRKPSTLHIIHPCPVRPVPAFLGSSFFPEFTAASPLVNLSSYKLQYPSHDPALFEKPRRCIPFPSSPKFHHKSHSQPHRWACWATDFGDIAPDSTSSIVGNAVGAQIIFFAQHVEENYWSVYLFINTAVDFSLLLVSISKGNGRGVSSSMYFLNIAA